MARFNRRSQSSIRPVQRIKHVIDSQFGQTLGVQNVIELIESNDNPAIANTKEVQTGSTVNGIYLHVEAYATTEAALSNFYLAVMKNPADVLTPPEANQIGVSDLKKYVIHQEMVMLQKEATGNPRTIFNGVIVIPRGYRRNGPGDSLELLTLSPGVNCDVCIQCHYKEFR